jgi:hypothetical protein
VKGARRVGWMERWQADAQRKGDQRAARWREHQDQKASTGQLGVMDRWAARAQSKGDESAARRQAIAPLAQLLRAGPVTGPSNSYAVIYVEMSGLSTQGADAAGPVVGLVCLLVGLAIWRLVFRRSYTVHVHINGGGEKVHVRMPGELAAYRAAAELVPRFQAEGPAAVDGWRADVLASKNVPDPTATPAGR